MKRWFGWVKALPWDRCSGCTGIPFLFSKDLVADGRPKRIMLLGEDLVAFRDLGAEGRPRCQCLRASRRADDVRTQRGLWLALRLSRLEIRRHRRGGGYPGRAGQEPVEGKGQDYRLPVPGTQRRGLDLHGPADRRSAGAAESGMESGSGRKRPSFDANPGMQLAAGAGGRNRFRPCADPAQPHRFQGRDQQMAGDARPASDFRVHAAGFWHEHRSEAAAGRTDQLLAGQPVHAAVLFAGAAAVDISRAERPRLGSDGRQSHNLPDVFLPPIRAAAGAHARGVRTWP